MPFRRPPFGLCLEPTPQRSFTILLTDEDRQTFTPYTFDIPGDLPFRIKIERRFFEQVGIRQGQRVYAPSPEAHL